MQARRRRLKQNHERHELFSFRFVQVIRFHSSISHSRSIVSCSLVYLCIVILSSVGGSVGLVCLCLILKPGYHHVWNVLGPWIAVDGVCRPHLGTLPCKVARNVYRFCPSYNHPIESVQHQVTLLGYYLSTLSLIITRHINRHGCAETSSKEAKACRQEHSQCHSSFPRILSRLSNVS